MKKNDIEMITERWNKITEAHPDQQVPDQKVARQVNTKMQRGMSPDAPDINFDSEDSASAIQDQDLGSGKRPEEIFSDLMDALENEEFPINPMWAKLVGEFFMEAAQNGGQLSSIDKLRQYLDGVALSDEGPKQRQQPDEDEYAGLPNIAGF